jgi:hypothetical protein
MNIIELTESLKTSVFRDLPLKNARFTAQRARNCKGTSENNRFSEVPLTYLAILQETVRDALFFLHFQHSLSKLILSIP